MFAVLQSFWSWREEVAEPRYASIWSRNVYFNGHLVFYSETSCSLQFFEELTIILRESEKEQKGSSHGGCLIYTSLVSFPLTSILMCYYIFTYFYEFFPCFNGCELRDLRQPWTVIYFSMQTFVSSLELVPFFFFDRKQRRMTTCFVYKRISVQLKTFKISQFSPVSLRALSAVQPREVLGVLILVTLEKIKKSIFILLISPDNS